MLGALKYAGFQFRLPEFAPKLARYRPRFIVPAGTLSDARILPKK